MISKRLQPFLSWHLTLRLPGDPFAFSLPSQFLNNCEDLGVLKRTVSRSLFSKFVFWIPSCASSDPHFDGMDWREWRRYFIGIWGPLFILLLSRSDIVHCRWLCLTGNCYQHLMTFRKARLLYKKWQQCLGWEVPLGNQWGQSVQNGIKQKLESKPNSFRSTLWILHLKSIANIISVH